MADADDQAKKNQHHFAVNSYHVAIVAAKTVRLLELEPFLKVVASYVECLLQTGKLMDAFRAGLEMTRLLPECSQVRVLGEGGGGGDG